MKFTALICLFFLPALPAAGQKLPKNGDNIVPNPGLEVFSNPPIGWTYKGADFGRVVKYWFSATTASPDVYGPGVRVPRDWADKGFGQQKAHGGNAMAGITVFGCDNGKPHCREYIEIQLAEPLVIGQHYELAFWTVPMTRSLYVNSLGGYFSVKPVERKTDEILIRTPQVQTPRMLVPTAPGKWIRVSGKFAATYEAEHLLIGNFNDDSNTVTESPGADSHNYAYYYIDDVSLRKIPPFIAPPVKDDDLTKMKLTPGQSFALKDIYFEFDRAELMPRSYVELHKLLRIMKEQPKVSIEVTGHTDSDGSEDYNIDLSRRRALAVHRFLLQNGIASRRLRVKGAGEGRPVASNETEEGRAQNRRVEITVLP